MTLAIPLSGRRYIYDVLSVLWSLLRLETVLSGFFVEIIAPSMAFIMTIDSLNSFEIGEGYILRKFSHPFVLLRCVFVYVCFRCRFSWAG